MKKRKKRKNILVLPHRVAVLSRENVRATNVLHKVVGVQLRDNGHRYKKAVSVRLNKQETPDLINVHKHQKIMSDRRSKRADLSNNVALNSHGVANNHAARNNHVVLSIRAPRSRVSRATNNHRVNPSNGVLSNLADLQMRRMQRHLRNRDNSQGKTSNDRRNQDHLNNEYHYRNLNNHQYLRKPTVGPAPHPRRA